MAEKDITEKSFIRLNDVFADVFNGLIFKGEQIVTPDSLETMDVSSQYRADDGSIHEMERDVLKLWKNYGINLVALGVENQTEADRDMPFRIVAYDGSVYRSQLLKTETKYDNGGLKSVLSKTRYPVITIVLYFNEERGWNSPTNLKGCFNPPLSDNDVMNRLDEFISDYKITIFDIGGMTMEEASVFKSDFREIAEHFIKVRNGGEYVPSERTITHVDEFLKLMSVMVGDKTYEEVVKKIHLQGEDKEGMNVSKWMQQIKRESLEEGVEKGRREGEAIVVIRMVEKFAKNNGTSIEEVLKLHDISMEQYNEYKLVLEGN